MKASSFLNVPAGAAEIRESREITSKAYQLPDGKIKLYLTTSPLHYIDDNGQFKTIDLTIQDNDTEFIVDKTFYNLSVPKNKIGFSYTSKVKGTADVELTHIGSAPVNTANLPPPRADGNKIWWDNVRPNLDIYLEISSLGVEFFKVIKTSGVPRDFQWEIIEDIDNNFGPNKKIQGKDNRGRSINVSSSKVPISTIGNRTVYKLNEDFTEQTTTMPDRKTRIRTWIDEIDYPVLVDVPDITESVTVGSDDIFTSAPLTNQFNPIRLYSANQNNYFGRGYSYFYGAGIRFQTLAIKRRATIVLAEFITNRGLDSGGVLVASLYGYDTDNANTWSLVGNRTPAEVARTSASIVWDNSPDTVRHDVTAVIQEIINRDGWAFNNNVSFIIIDTGTISNGPYSSITSLENDGGPTLEITLLAEEGPASALSVFGSKGIKGSFVG